MQHFPAINKRAIRSRCFCSFSFPLLQSKYPFSNVCCVSVIHRSINNPSVMIYHPSNTILFTPQSSNIIQLIRNQHIGQGTATIDIIDINERSRSTSGQHILLDQQTYAPLLHSTLRHPLSSLTPCHFYSFFYAQLCYGQNCSHNIISALLSTFSPTLPLKE